MPILNLLQEFVIPNTGVQGIFFEEDNKPFMEDLEL
jgi:hypothetical protein